MPQLMGLMSLIISLAGYRKYRYLLNPITSMFFLWGIILPFSNLGLYEVNNPNDRVYVIISIGLLSYLAGSLMGDRISSVDFRFEKQKEYRTRQLFSYAYQIRYPVIYALSAIAIVYYFSQFVVVLRLLLSGRTLAYIRQLNTMGEENVLYSSYLVYLVKVFIAIPTTYVMVALLPIELFLGKRNRVLIVEALLLLVLYVITTAGRSVILFALIYFTNVFLMYSKKIRRISFKRFKKYKRAIVIIGVAAILFLLAITTARKGSNVDLLRQFYVYYVAPIPHFDHYIGIVDMSGVYGNYLSSFYGIVYPCLFILKFIGVFREYPSFVETIHYMSFEMMERGTNIGGNLYMNAFVTIFYQPYLDARYIGVIVCLFVFGLMCGRSFKRAYYSNNLRSLLIYNLLLQKIFSSVVRFYFTQQAQSLAFVIAIFIISRKRILKLDDNREREHGFSNHSKLQSSALYTKVH